MNAPPIPVSSLALPVTASAWRVCSTTTSRHKPIKVWSYAYRARASMPLRGHQRSGKYRLTSKGMLTMPTTVRKTTIPWQVWPTGTTVFIDWFMKRPTSNYSLVVWPTSMEVLSTTCAMATILRMCVCMPTSMPPCVCFGTPTSNASRSCCATNLMSL